ncbi:guanosine-3',5'-bis 3'-pyrophosphohydrolase MESH1-like protein [Piptocephalis cylindrospora]|uniref:Guanosine-3',5'-bis(diphosphate) 3'-pyrophosphohydrolase MESH1 n=1 Tax=Piptocephalis cylindrospora TaxID=1907219 RepID=A0A4P9Y8W4_9FUNG|nr:guanosine-3',5'-bis 3'-pyrophosphohydrolase MESH1-like protein [Piptocephalis cylindrospora]|eukprot:RKP15264.1 guanosine-3',5'-bis 3'-pyrophosphohydrolase MESH1-like protein [Piptocephalis cylindrospora]
MVNLDLLLQTAEYAAKKHRDQRRKDPEQTPYINHPLGVTRLLTSAGITHLPTLQAALLHDTVEDTDTTVSEVCTVFGLEVATIVKECTDDTTLPKAERKRRQILAAPTVSLEAKRVKLADKLYNLRDLLRTLPLGWTDERKLEYFAWAKKVTDGCQGACPPLEDQLKQLYQEVLGV